MYLELEEDKEDWKRLREVKCVQVLDIPKESGLREPIVGVKLYSKRTSSSSNASKYNKSASSQEQTKSLCQNY